MPNVLSILSSLLVFCFITSSSNREVFITVDEEECISILYHYLNHYLKIEDKFILD